MRQRLQGAVFFLLNTASFSPFSGKAQGIEFLGVDVARNLVRFGLRIHAGVVNMLGSLHGGCIGHLTDMVCLRDCSRVIVAIQLFIMSFCYV